MKTEVISNPLLLSEDMNTSTMSMDTAGIGMATLFLRDKIYSNKIGAVVREYTSNAADEHKKHNIEIPVKVSLTDDTFSVRDYALGLDDNGIRNIFGMYFKSTKSNDNSQIGGFGIGSKSGHCYTDTFYVKSYHNGVCTLYACALGGKGGVPVGQIIEIEQSETTETGLEVFMNINPSDRHKFFTEIRKFVDTSNQKIEFHYSDIVDGTVTDVVKVPLEPESVEQHGDYVFKIYDFKNSRNHYNYGCDGNHSLICKMGDVVYPPPSSSILGIKYDRKTEFGKLMVVEIPIGKLSLPISREKFEDTASNLAVFEEITKIDYDIYQRGLDELETLSLRDAVEMGNSDPIVYRDSTRHVRDSKNYYVYPTKIAFKHYHDGGFTFIKGTLLNDETSFEKMGDKYLVAIIPNNKYSGNWISRLSEAAKSNSKKYYYCVESCWDRFTSEFKLEFDELFEIKPVRDKIFAVPPMKREKVDGEKYYNVYNTYGYGRDATRPYNASPLDIHNLICGKNLQEEDDVKTYIEKIAKESSDVSKLEKVSITLVKPGQDAPVGCWTRSIKMFNLMLELGWYDADGKALRDDCDAIRERYRLAEKDRRLKNLSNVSILPSSVRMKLESFMHKKPKNVSRVRKVLDSLGSEDSFRGVVWGAVNKQGISLDRNRIRAILKLTEV